MACEFCRSFPHLPGCPNAPELRALHTCKYCGEGIIVEDDYAEIGGDYYHIWCLEDIGMEDVLKLLGVDVSTVSEDDFE